MSHHVTQEALLRRLGVSSPEEGEGTLGAAGQAEAEAIDAHLQGCGPCRRLYGALALAHEPGTEEEEALIARMVRERSVGELVSKVLGSDEPLVSRQTAHRPNGSRGFISLIGEGRRRRRSVWAAAAVAAAMAAVAWVDIGPKVETEAKEEVRLVWGGRAVEGRVAHGSYTPYSADRGDWAPLARSAGVVADPGSLAGEFLWRGEAGDLIRAEETLRRQPKEPARENDIGVLLLAQERYREAAAAFDRVLAKEPQMLAALFNAALAQEKLGNRARAAAAWERYLDVAAERDEAGWIEEAEAYLQASTKAASVR